MTTQNRLSDRNRDQQDGYERGLWGELEYVDGAGAVLKIRGTGVDGGTLDEEVPFLNTGYGFNVAKDYNTEVVMFSLGSDTNQKYAVPTIPRDKQRQWPAGTGGIQHPTNAEKFIQLDDESVWLRDGTFHVGNDKEVTISVADGKATISVNAFTVVSPTITLDGNVEITGDLEVGGAMTSQGVNVGNDHRHTGVTSGPDNTGTPEQ